MEGVLVSAKKAGSTITVTVVSDTNGRITEFQEKPAPEKAKSRMASTGIYIFEPEVLNMIPSGQVFDIGGQLFPLLAEKGLPFYSQSRWFNWIDIGRVTDYWAVCQRVLRGEVAQMDMPGREVRPGVWVGLNTSIDFDKVDITGPVYIGSSSEIEPGATIVGPAWLGNGCVLRGGSKLIRSILFDYTRLSEGQTLEDMIVSPNYCVDRHGNTTYPGDEGTPALSPDGSRVYVGGDFTSVDGVAHAHLAAFDTATGQLDNNRRLRTVRHDIARIYTILRERELGLSVAPNDNDEAKEEVGA